jgi:hypothetical protein
VRGPVRNGSSGRPFNGIVRPQLPMTGASAICAVCGKRHPVTESELFFQRPDAIWEIPKGERAKRCKESDDLCVLWGKGFKHDRHFVRAVLPLPDDGRERPYRIGVWVEMTEKDFHRVVDLWNAPDQTDEPPFKAKLANQLPIEEKSIDLPVTLQLAGPTDRPAVVIPKSKHLLYKEQSLGITPHRAYEYTPSPK